VTCNPDLGAADNLWNVEAHVNSNLPKESIDSVQQSFFSSFVELNFAMAHVNNRLLPKEGEESSQPWHWPISYKGQRFTSWGDGDRRVYLLGNVVVFFGILLVFLLFFVLAALDAILRQRGIKETQAELKWKSETLTGCWTMFIGWALHYLPFWFMGRVLYFHHYMPALLFGGMFLAIFLHYVIQVSGDLFQASLPWIRQTLLCIVCAGLIGSFVFFSPTSYGMTSPRSECAYLRMFPSWEI
jgi:dolichyl-phosphate-mannose-protein mannosyltransferase